MESPAPTADGQPRERPQPSILLVDDEPLVLSTLSDMLQHLGFRVIAAPDGTAALELAAAPHGNADVALLDLTLSEPDSRAVLERLKQAQPSIRVLLTSGYPPDDRTRRLLAAGADGFVQKPFRLATLQEHIFGALQTGQA
jgi:two-component system cell cycle sensor histidine kinase/response regulator CckA